MRGREVIVIFDADEGAAPTGAAARKHLAGACDLTVVEWPEELKGTGVNGIDDSAREPRRRGVNILMLSAPPAGVRATPAPPERPAVAPAVNERRRLQRAKARQRLREWPRH